MVYRIESEVNVPTFGSYKYFHEQTFDDNSNVFERIAEYHEHMKKVFPGSAFKCIKATRTDKERKKTK